MQSEIGKMNKAAMEKYEMIDKRVVCLERHVEDALALEAARSKDDDDDMDGSEDGDEDEDAEGEEEEENMAVKGPQKEQTGVVESDATIPDGVSDRVVEGFENFDW